jgi:mannose-6-phosphate isomerase-like protein (cupin superfamily)
MPITKTNKSISISGEEYQQWVLLHEKIKSGEDIEALILEIPPAYLLDMLNLTKSYITRDLCNSDGLSAVHLAAREGNLQALRSFARLKADFSLRTDNYGKSALHLAAADNHVEVIKFLIDEMGIDVDIPTTPTSYYEGYSESPLFVCAVHSNVEAAEALLESGANVNYINSKGFTPLDNAGRYGYMWNTEAKVSDFAELLIKNGAKKSIDLPRQEKKTSAPNSAGFFSPAPVEVTKSTVVEKKQDCDYLAPDGSEIRLLLKSEHSERGGLCHCTLPAGKTSIAAKHKTVEELWYFVSGQGEVWLKQGATETVHPVKSGVALSIPPGAGFQFRNLSENDNLEFIITTMPHWPGPEEAILLDEGKWTPSVNQVALGNV